MARSLRITELNLDYCANSRTAKYDYAWNDQQNHPVSTSESTEKAQIAVDSADYLYQLLRIENT